MTSTDFRKARNAVIGARLHRALQTGAVVLTSGAVGALASSAAGPLVAGLAIAVGAASSVIASDLLAKREQRRLDEVDDALDLLASGDTSRRLVPHRLGALAAIAHTHNRIAERMDRTGASLADLAAGLRRLPSEVASGLQAAEQSSSDQEAAVEENAALLANINSSIRGISRAVGTLATSNEEGASSILEMGTAIEQVASGAATLQTTIESSTTSIHQLGASIRSVSENTDSVQRVAEETAASMIEMDRTIQDVGEHTRSAAELTERVAESAENGTRAVDSTIDSIADIRGLTRDAKSAMEGLAERIGEIGNIANVIGSVSDETNLLSLNAAIIAAQAGDHGKPFAVVADQVKTLARRTTASAKDIERLIQAVQTESENAVRAMDAGIAGVEEGVERSRSAGDALTEIRAAARDASGRVAEIARAAEEQARNSRYVAEAGQQTSSLVQQISSAVNEQAESSEQLLSNATAVVDMSRQIARSTDEQRASSRAIGSQIEAITEMIKAIQDDIASQERASAALAETFDGLLATARASSRQIPEVAQAIAEICERVEGVRVEPPRD